MIKIQLHKPDLGPRLLLVEITESMVLNDVAEVISQVNDIRSLGVRVAIDDFAIGYPSFGLLDQIPTDILKLDRLFMKDLETQRRSTIVHAIIIMATNLGMDVIVEGVETKEDVSD